MLLFHLREEENYVRQNDLFMGFEQPQQINWQSKAEQRSSLVVTLMEYDSLKSCQRTVAVIDL